MTEELKPGFAIKEAAQDALENDEDVAMAVQAVLASRGQGRYHDRGDNDPRGDDPRGFEREDFDSGYDTSSGDDGLF